VDVGSGEGDREVDVTLERDHLKGADVDFGTRPTARRSFWESDAVEKLFAVFVGNKVDGNTRSDAGDVLFDFRTLVYLRRRW